MDYNIIEQQTPDNKLVNMLEEENFESEEYNTLMKRAKFNSSKVNRKKKVRNNPQSSKSLFW